HPHVVTVYDAGEAEGTLYIAMEFVQGTDLHGLLHEDALKPEVAVGILSQVASALDAAHAIGLLHRDIKPGNVLVASAGGDGEVPHCYLTDFGLSKHITMDSVALTAPGDFVGTVAYTAPEQMLDKDLDARTDVYSLGCLLYECLAGRPPFMALSEVEMMQAHIEQSPPKLTKKRSGTLSALSDVVARAMAKEPRERYATCGELMEAARAAAGMDSIPFVVEGADPGGASRGKLALNVTAGNAAGTVIEVEDEFLIGREATGEGTLADDTEVSRRHAQITRTADGEFVIEDLGSTNGTIVNGRTISSPETLRDGDAIELGGTKLAVDLSATTAPAPPVPEPEPEPTPEPPSTETPGAAPLAAEPEVPAAPPRLSLRLDVDLASGEVLLELDEASEPVRFVHEDGRWRVAR
ncbi:MAG: hypothetical protein QOK04_1555, partial [Solirubrobacteraceae bacterium]|nr:hypothetical protein [Solirubrobacteraceae bacterium]